MVPEDVASCMLCALSIFTWAHGAPTSTAVESSLDEFHVSSSDAASIKRITRAIKARDTQANEEISREPRHDLPDVGFGAPAGATSTFRIDSCSAQVLWHKGGREDGGPLPNAISWDEVGLRNAIVSSPDDYRGEPFANVKSRVQFLYHIAKFDWWGLQGRFVFDDADNTDCQQGFSVAFSHPAVPASAQPDDQRIPVKVKDNPYNKFFSVTDGINNDDIKSSWLGALLDAMPQEEKRRGFSRTDNVTETLRRSLELFSNTTAVARGIEFTNKNISPEARTVLGWWRDTPVFVTYPNQEQDGTSKTIIQTVWNVTDLQNFSTTKFQNYLPRKMGSEVRLGKENQGDFYEWFDFSSSGMNDIKYTLVYLDGAVRPQGSGSRLGAVSNLAVAYTEPWSIFADGRFD